MTNYQSLDGTTYTDFRFNTQGEYHNENPTLRPLRRKEIKRSSGFGSVCPSCGIIRSRCNKCECNS